ncbi:MAG: hypothetical protein SangKO_075760 [Sandaracinaceae bacterium]
MAVDFKLTRSDEVDATNPVVGDLHVSGGEVVIVSGVDATVQEIETRLRWWRGEWSFDRSQGVPYLGEILRKGVDLATVRALLEREILRVPAVRRVDSAELEVDPRTRRLSGRLTIRVNDGTAAGAAAQVEV